jgi:hypothetical protein
VPLTPYLRAGRVLLPTNKEYFNMFSFVPPKTPESVMELVDALSPEEKAESPFSIFAKLPGSQKAVLRDLASQIRTAESKEERSTAVDSMRSALAALGFDEDWIASIFGKQSRASKGQGSRDSGLEKIAREALGQLSANRAWPLKRDNHESNCRLFSKPEADGENAAEWGE